MALDLPYETARTRVLLATYHNALRPRSEDGGYVNFMAADDAAKVHATYRHNYDRLTRSNAATTPPTFSASTTTSPHEPGQVVILETGHT